MNHLGYSTRRPGLLTCTLSFLKRTNGTTWLRLLSGDPVKTQYLLHNASGIFWTTAVSSTGRFCLANLTPQASFTFTLYYTLTGIQLQATDLGMPRTSKGRQQLDLALAVLALFDRWRKCPLIVPSTLRKRLTETPSKIMTSMASGSSQQPCKRLCRSLF